MNNKKETCDEFGTKNTVVSCPNHIALRNTVLFSIEIKVF